MMRLNPPYERPSDYRPEYGSERVSDGFNPPSQIGLTDFPTTFAVDGLRKVKVENKRLKNSRNRVVRQLEQLALQFPVYFQHQLEKAKEHAQNHKPAVKTGSLSEAGVSEQGLLKPKAEAIQQRQRLSAGANAIKRQKASKTRKGKSGDNLSKD